MTPQVVAISCGLKHTAAITESGKVGSCLEWVWMWVGSCLYSGCGYAVCSIHPLRMNCRCLPLSDIKFVLWICWMHKRIIFLLYLAAQSTTPPLDHTPSHLNHPPLDPATNPSPRCPTALHLGARARWCSRPRRQTDAKGTQTSQ